MNDSGFWTDIFPNYLAGVGTVATVVVALWQTKRANDARDQSVKERFEAENSAENKILHILDVETYDQRQILKDFAEALSSESRMLEHAYESEPQPSEIDLKKGMLGQLSDLRLHIYRNKVLTTLNNYKESISNTLNKYHEILSEERFKQITKKINVIKNCYDSLDYVYNLPYEYAGNWNFDETSNHLDEMFDTERELTELYRSFTENKK